MPIKSEADKVFRPNADLFNRAWYRMELLRAYELNMMEYYRGVNDTAKFMTAAKEYYNRFVMSMPVGSVFIADSLRRIKLLAQAKPETVQEGNRTVTTKSITFMPLAQTLMNELNRGAWDVYRMTRNPEYIQTALQWSKRALEFVRVPRCNGYACKAVVRKRKAARSY